MFYDYEAINMAGETIKMDKYKGKVVLVVNTASKCGFTPQLTGLENLYEKYNEKGLEILGFPCNQFKNQDPGTSEEIVKFCTGTFGVQFELFEKIDVKGENKHPLYEYLINEKKGLFGKEIKWNFTKFLINRDGEVVKRFAPSTEPEKFEDDIVALL